MKTIIQFSILLSVILFSGCETTPVDSSSEGAKPVAAAGDEVNPVLIFEYDESHHMHRQTRYNSINNEMDRFNYLQQNFEPVFKEALSGYDFDFQLYPAKAPDNAKIVEVSFLSLDSPSPIELELRLWVILRQGNEKADLGITHCRIVPQNPITDSSVDRDLNSLYTDAATKVLEKVAGEL